MPFIPPMLSCRLTDERLLADSRYVAEPKLDGQRAQVHVAGGRTVAAYSRPGCDLLHHRGLGWLRDVRWPAPAAVVDGELYSGDGAEGIDAVLMARGQAGSRVAFAAFDLLAVDGREVMAEPWADRRKRLEDLVARRRGRSPGPAGADLRRTSASLAGLGGGMGWRGHRADGPAVRLSAGARSPAWFKAKHKLTGAW